MQGYYLPNTDRRTRHYVDGSRHRNILQLGLFVRELRTSEGPHTQDRAEIPMHIHTFDRERDGRQASHESIEKQEEHGGSGCRRLETTVRIIKGRGGARMLKLIEKYKQETIKKLEASGAKAITLYIVKEKFDELMKEADQVEFEKRQPEKK
jgi:hypothetical protein